MLRKRKVLQFLERSPLNFTQINTAAKRISTKRDFNIWVAYTRNFKTISIKQVDLSKPPIYQKKHTNMNTLNETFKNGAAIMSLIWSVGKMQEWVQRNQY